MKEVLAFIETKKQEFAKLPFFEFLQDKSIHPKQRLAFAPCVAPFAMNFGDLNKFILREENPTNRIQEIINIHTYEDDHHWLWFLEDLKKLGLDQSQSFTNSLKFIWSEEAKHTRLVCTQIALLYAHQTNPKLRLAISEAIEATGHVILFRTAQVAQELQATTQQKYRYFGPSHFDVETGHPIGTDHVEEFVEAIELDDQTQQQACELVEQVFAAFTDVVNEFMAYAKAKKLDQSPTKVLSFQPASPESRTEFEYLVIGAGPAGLQLGYFLEKANRDYLILEAGDSPGTFFKDFPRHRQLISINKLHTGYDDREINLRWDWNSLLCDSEALSFKHYSQRYFPHADDLVRYLEDFAAHYQLKIQYGVQVVRIAKDDKFRVIDAQGQVYTCQHLIIATGFTKLYIPPIPGIELAEPYTDVSINPDDFKNQRVLILGKGNSAFETADNLVETTSLLHLASPTPISMAWRTKYVGHLRAVNNNVLDSYQLKSQNVILDAFVNKIVRQGDKLVVTVSYTHANGEQEDLIYDRIILCTGFQFDSTIFDASCRPALTINDRFPAQTSEWESTNIQDLYFAGTLMHMRDYKKKQSGFIHGFRYNIQALHHILEQKYHQQAWPCQLLEPTPASLTQAILDRVNRSSGLWQQTGFLCDLIVVLGQGQAAQYYQEVPADYVQTSAFGQSHHYYTVTLEFGQAIINASPDPFAITRVHKDDADQAAFSTGIHPIVRRFCGKTLIAEHHVIEDLASEWLEAVHERPLLAFLQEQLSRKTAPHQFSEAATYPMLPGTTKRLGTYLIEAGLVTSEQVEVALSNQKLTAIPLGQLLASHGWVSQQTIEYLMEKVIMPERQLTAIAN
jgi:thioredoxin reductase